MPGVYARKCCHWPLFLWVLMFGERRQGAHCAPHVTLLELFSLWMQDGTLGVPEMWSWKWPLLPGLLSATLCNQGKPEQKELKCRGEDTQMTRKVLSALLCP